MAYDIELISIGEDLYPALGDSASLLNAVQREFAFRVPSPAQRQDGLAFRRTEYATADIWTFLREQRAKYGGYRPFIIAFVNAPLKSSELSNIFGSHEAAEGLAVVTLHSSTQYVREARRYCCYYMTRYALSFVNPLIRAHGDPDRKDCYFHRKIYKPEIRASMDRGLICDKCQDLLDHPPEGSTAHKLSVDERDALLKMRQVVSGEYPHALVMKGGGVKGLAFAGALMELEKYYWFDRHVGASAGAIAAALLAGGFSPTELADLLSRKSFNEFKDAPLWKLPFNLIFRQGCYPGNRFRSWIGELLRSKIAKQSDVLMSDLNGAVFYATMRGIGDLTFDSAGQRKDAIATFALRCSMSIPFVFIPERVDGRRVFDGGLRNNFPVTRFLKDHPSTPFVALYLSAKKVEDKRWLGGELLDIFVEGDERRIVDENLNSVVVIDTTPIGTIDFGMRDIEKDFLLKVGEAAALTFLNRQNLDNGPDQGTVDAACKKAEELRNQVRCLRRRNKIVHRALFLMLLVLIAIAYLFGPRIWHLVVNAFASGAGS